MPSRRSIESTIGARRYSQWGASPGRCREVTHGSATRCSCRGSSAREKSSGWNCSLPAQDFVTPSKPPDCLSSRGIASDAKSHRGHDGRVVRAHADLDRGADRLDLFDLFEILALARADDAEAARPDLRVPDPRYAADPLPAEPLDLVRVHAHLGRRPGAGRVVLVDRLGDRLEVLRLRAQAAASPPRPRWS